MTDWWRNRRVLVTGHTGFKGAWLCLWLQKCGAQVSALALLPETQPSLHALAGPWTGQDHRVVDIRDAAAVLTAVQDMRPEIVFHMAAQALVRRSYREPADTYAVNVTGSINVMEAIRRTPGVKAVVMVTTDKVYENPERGTPFRETDRLGGHDPYSNSKACMELAVQAWRDGFFRESGVAVATARAGNVVGGGDWAEDRLVPDIVRAFERNEPLVLRNPASVRPWQHVLDPLNGYMMLARALVDFPERVPHALNFGPKPEGFLTVADIVDEFSRAFGGDIQRHGAAGPQPREAAILTLDTALSQKTIGWSPRLNIRDTISWAAAWYKAWLGGADVRALCLDQIGRFEALVARKDAA